MTLPKIGDKVFVRNADDIDIMDVQFGFNRHMENYCGKIVTITDITYNGAASKKKPRFKIEEDDGYWSWSIDMFDIGKKVSKSAPIKSKNPQAITTLDKLDNVSLFRVGGLFEGKARVCTVTFGKNGQLRPAVSFETLIGNPVEYELPEAELMKKLESGEITIMCIERG